MPKKTVREMTAYERKHYSLEGKVFRATVMGSVLLGMVALMIGFGLYLYAVINQYVSEAYNLTRSAEPILRRVIYFEPFVSSVMDIYHTQSEGERNEIGTEEYRARFSQVSEQPEYSTAIALLDTFKEASDVSDLYIGMYDRETSSLVYISDPDTRPGYIREPGDWETVESREIEKFLSWDGNGRLYDISKTDQYGWMCTAGIPMRNEAGDPIAFVLADVTLEDVGRAVKTFLIQYALAMFLVVNGYALLLIRHMKKTLVEPINSITEAAKQYVSAKQSGIQTTDVFSMLNIRTGDEVENLSLVMADMERDLSEYVDNLTAITAEKERIGTELELAKRIQADMLPNIFPAFPDRKDFNIYASMYPAKEVGGDFYDFFLLDETHLCMVIADVSGKGIPAALFMMVSNLLVKNSASSGYSPKDVLKIVNEQITRNNREEMFVTIWLGVLDLETGVLTAANAGHEYPVLKQPGEEFKLVKQRHGFVIGGLEGIHYDEYSLMMQKGAKLFLYTDGIPEATNERDEFFGTERMLQTLNEAKNESPETILHHVKQKVEEFVKTAPQFDDMTMLCVEYIGRKSVNEQAER